jgi:nucleoside-specific outer membrane channel protein Tsx
MKKKIALVALAAAAVGVQAAEWSDTSINLRRGSEFGEPYHGAGKNDITKNIVGLTHVNGYKYGSNFINVDLLMSNQNDPAYAGSSTGAQEFYAVYRNTVDFSKVTGKSYKSGFVRGLGATAGFDFNAKADQGYNSKKQMFVAGPTVMLDVPAGFLNVSLLQLWETNSPNNTDRNNTYYGGVNRYTYKPHPMLSASWAIPFSVASVPLEFAGYANFISSKGKLENGADSRAETNIDFQVMYDISSSVGATPKTLKVGAEYQYWKNKFGNDYTGAAGTGAFAKTPMVRIQYHF